MTYYEGTGVAAVEVFKEGSEGCTLFGGASVGRGAVGIKASFIADADAMAVVVLHMGADNRFWSAWFDAAISTDNIVVADAITIASCSVPFVNLTGGAGLVRLHC